MFSQLSKLLRKGDTVGLTIGIEGEAGGKPTFRVNIMPKLFTLDGEKGADRMALNQPLSVTGTAEELDSAEFVTTLERFAASTVTHRTTIDEVEAAHKTASAAKREAAAKKTPAKTAAKTPPAPPKPKTTPSGAKAAPSAPKKVAPKGGPAAPKKVAPAAAKPTPPPPAPSAETATPSLLA
jgi:PRTRC genetic system protein E